MFRPAFALLAIALVTGAITLWEGQYNAFPANLLIMGGVPVAVSWAIYRLVDGRLPNHMFIYIFLNAFFGAALAILAVGLASTGFAWAVGAYDLDYLLAEYLPFYLLMAWSEAFATGMVVTLLVVYKPQWVATFDDRRYLQR
ncbi:MAG: energy-coupling factor ABC transporter permease, partial [Thiobacillaceae bacterium]|nr:energy-coupling factor ABC transporter permease [Thiobacillaceae bacterium]